VKSTASTPDEIRVDLLERMGSAIDIVRALDLFPYAPRWAVPAVLDKLVAEGVLEREGTFYRRAHQGSA
jgi:hypothetical protein